MAERQTIAVISNLQRGYMDRPITTLFMLMSVDGKISTGSSDELDVDRDFPTLWNRVLLC